MNSDVVVLNWVFLHLRRFITKAYRYMFGCKDNDGFFWQRVDEARLLLTRLNDEDIACPSARALLVRRYENKLDACQAIYGAWCHITIRIKKLMDREFEVDPWWEQRYISCSEHIFDRCMAYLQNEEKASMDTSIMNIFSDVLQKTRWKNGTTNEITARNPR